MCHGWQKFFAVLAVLSLTSFAVAAPLEIRITGGEIQSTSIAITPFYTAISAPKEEKMMTNVRRVIENDLVSSGVFKAKKKFAQKPDQMRFAVQFKDWHPLSVNVVATGNYRRETNGKLVVDFFLWDILAERQIFAKEYVVVAENWRRLAHVIADDIYKSITGTPGYFDSRIVYVATDKVGERIRKRLILMDSDGGSAKILTSGKYFVLTPHFSSDGDKIAYLSYERGVPTVYVDDLNTGKVIYLARRNRDKSMKYAPHFSPDGKTLIFAYALGNVSNIWTMDLKTYVFKQITRDPYIDTSPSFAPDGRSIVFSSDRNGSLQLYRLYLQSGVVDRISHGKGSYSTPAWSPKGDKIVFTKQLSGSFYIGIMDSDGSNEKLLSHSFLDEGPVFSPNGQFILFSRDTGKGKKRHLMIMDIKGRMLHVLPTQYSATDPDWSSINLR